MRGFALGAVAVVVVLSACGSDSSVAGAGGSAIGGGGGAPNGQAGQNSGGTAKGGGGAGLGAVGGAGGSGGGGAGAVATGQGTGGGDGKPDSGQTAQGGSSVVGEGGVGGFSQDAASDSAVAGNDANADASSQTEASHADGAPGQDASADARNLPLLTVTPCADKYWSSESGVASQTNCRLSDACGTSETKYVRLQIHAVMDAYPIAGSDYPVEPYAIPPTVNRTRAYYVPDKVSAPSSGETASQGTVHVIAVHMNDAGTAITGVTVQAEVPFDTVRISGTFECPVVEQ